MPGNEHRPVLSYRKLAVTVVSDVMVTVQERESPEQPAPVQPFQVEPADGAAVTVTTVPSRKLDPDGLLLAEPLPLVFITSL